MRERIQNRSCEVGAPGLFDCELKEVHSPMPPDPLGDGRGTAREEAGPVRRERNPEKTPPPVKEPLGNFRIIGKSRVASPEQRWDLGTNGNTENGIE